MNNNSFELNEEIFHALPKILEYKANGKDIDTIINELSLQDCRHIRDLIQIAFCEADNDMDEIKIKMGNYLKNKNNEKITYLEVKPIRVCVVFSNPFSSDLYTNLDFACQKELKEMVRKISINKTKEVCMKFNSKNYEILPVEYHNDNFGPWKYDPLADQCRIYVTLSEDKELPKYWKLSENAYVNVVPVSFPNSINYENKILSENMPLGEFLEKLTGDPRLVELFYDKFWIKTVHDLKNVQQTGWDKIQNYLPAHAEKIREATNKLTSESFLKDESNKTDINYNMKLWHKWHKFWLSLCFYSKSDYKKLSPLDKSALNKCFEEQRNDKIFDIGPILNQIEQALEVFTIPLDKEEMREKSHGMLLYGPPGTGKTKLSKIIINCAGLEPLVEPLSSSELNRSLVGATEALLMDIWNRAKVCPHWLCCVAIDEVDALTPKRNDKAAGHKIDALSLLLSLIGGIKDVSNVFVIASTNRLSKIDEAFSRRLQDKFYIGKLTNEQRVNLLKQIQHNPKAHLPAHVDINFDRMSDLLAKLTTNFSGAALSSFRSRIVFYFDLRSKDKSVTTIGKEILIDLAAKVAHDFQIRLGRFYIPLLLQNSSPIKDIWQGIRNDLELFSGRVLMDFRKNKASIQFEYFKTDDAFEIEIDDDINFVADIVPYILEFCTKFKIDQISFIDTDILTQSCALDEIASSELINDCLDEFEKIQTGLILFDVDTLVGISESQSGHDKNSSYSVQNQRLWQNIIHSFRKSYYSPDLDRKKWCIFASSSEYLIKQFKKVAKFPKSKEEKKNEEIEIKQKTKKLKCSKCDHWYFEVDNNFDSCFYHPGLLVRLTDKEHSVTKENLLNRLRAQTDPDSIGDILNNFYYLCCMRPFSESRDGGCQQDKHGQQDTQ